MPSLPLHTQITEALDWSHTGLRASLCVWAAGPGSESLGAGKLSTSSKNSLFGEQLLKVGWSVKPVGRGILCSVWGLWQLQLCWVVACLLGKCMCGPHTPRGMVAGG